MPTRSHRPWPVSRATAKVLAAGAAVAALAWFVPPMRGGLFLLACMAAAFGLIVHTARTST